MIKSVVLLYAKNVKLATILVGDKMGMFDELTCKHKLPDNDTNEKTVFQTKNLECKLNRYEITVDGRLRLARHGNYPGWHVERKMREPIDYDGCLYFYATNDGTDEKVYKRYEYVATFVNNIVVNIKRCTRYD